MPIEPSEIKYYRSADGSSIGGAITAVEVTSAANTLFDAVAGVEADDGDTEYRCIYLKNSNPTLPFLLPRVFIKTNTPSTYTTAEIGLGVSDIDGVEPSIADESTAPEGVVFSTASGYANGWVIPTLLPGQHKAVWIKRVVDSNARAYNADSVIISATGGTS